MQVKDIKTHETLILQKRCESVSFIVFFGLMVTTLQTHIRCSLEIDLDHAIIQRDEPSHKIHAKWKFLTIQYINQFFKQ